MRRRGLSRWELGLGLGLALLAAALARPRVRTFIWRSQRAEVSLVLESMRIAQVAERGRTGRWFALPASPRGPGGVGRDRVPWAPDGPWMPPLPAVRGSYRVDGDGDAVRFVGECDVDGDGVRAVYVATPGQPTMRVTPSEVY